MTEGPFCQIRAHYLFHTYFIVFHCRCNVHGRPKEYECDVCNSKFGTVAELNVHNKRVHQEDTHKCDTCGKSFTTCSALKDHTDTHTGAKRHVCQCGKAYRYATGLSRHKKQCDAAKNG